MNELRQLQYTLPLIEKERQYRRLAQQIKKAVNEGRDTLTMKLGIRLSDEAMTALSDADIQVIPSCDGNFDYEFKMGGTD